MRARWNQEIIESLAKAARERLEALGCTKVEEHFVSGSFELPFACKNLILTQKPDAVIAIGVLIKVCNIGFAISTASDGDPGIHDAF